MGATKILLAMASLIGSSLTAIAQWWIKQQEKAQEELFSASDANRLNRKKLFFLLLQSANVNATAKNGWTVLHSAASVGNEEVVQALLASGTDVNARNSNGSTALQIASSRGYNKIANLLRQHGAKE